MIRRTVLTLMLAAGIATPALAHGPVRLKVVLTQKLNATPDEVWAAVGNFQDMSWHPAVAKLEGTDGNTPDKATRVLHLKADAGDPTITEALHKYDAAKRSYSYGITAVDPKVLPVTNYASTITVKDDGGKALVEWKGGFYRGYPNNNPPAELNDEAATKAVTGVYEAGLKALADKFGARE